jgi:hypothetical protein
MVHGTWSKTNGKGIGSKGQGVGYKVRFNTFGLSDLSLNPLASYLLSVIFCLSPFTFCPKLIISLLFGTGLNESGQHAGNTLTFTFNMIEILLFDITNF